MLRDQEDGLPVERRRYTLAEAVDDWALRWTPQTSGGRSDGWSRCRLEQGGVDAEGAATELVSLLSSTGMSIEDISHLVGHASTNVTEKVYRKELRPMLTKGARAMDGLFSEEAR